MGVRPLVQGPEIESMMQRHVKLIQVVTLVSHLIILLLRWVAEKETEP